jgi:hypothetical protein
MARRRSAFLLYEMRTAGLDLAITIDAWCRPHEPVGGGDGGRADT